MGNIVLLLKAACHGPESFVFLRYSGFSSLGLSFDYASIVCIQHYSHSRVLVHVYFSSWFQFSPPLCLFFVLCVKLISMSVFCIVLMFGPFSQS